MIQFDYSNIFQMGWNHQLACFALCNLPPPTEKHTVKHYSLNDVPLHYTLKL